MRFLHTSCVLIPYSFQGLKKGPPGSPRRFRPTPLASFRCALGSQLVSPPTGNEMVMSETGQVVSYRNAEAFTGQ